MAGDSIKFNASLNTAGFESGAKKLQGVAAGAASGISQHFGKIAMAVAGITAAFLGVRAAVQSFNAAIAMGGQLNDLSARTGETAGNLAILQRAFQNAGAGAEAVGPTINRLQRAIVEAGEGSKTYAAAFQKLGLDLNDLKTKTPTEQLRAVAEAIKGIENPSEQTAIAMQILGRSGGELMPLLKAMGGEFDRAGQQLGSLPGIIDRTNEHLDRIGDNFKAIGEKGKEFMVGLLERLAPGLADLTDRLANIDAAGFGAKLSEYAEKTAMWIAETFKLKDALNQIEVAINAITQGNFAEGFQLMFMTARNTAFNAINEIVAAATAAVETVTGAISNIFRSNGPMLHLLKTSFTIGANYFKEVLMTAMASVLENFGPWGKKIAGVMRYEAETAANSIKMLTKGIGAQIDLVGEDAKETFAAIPQKFAESYAANAADPLIDMRERLAEAEELSARLAENIAAAGDASNTVNPGGAGAGGTSSASDRIEREEAEARAKHSAPGGGRSGGGGRPFSPTSSYGDALRERGQQSVNYDPASSRPSSTGLAIERTKERFSADRTASGIRADLARLDNRNRPAEDRASRFEASGMFGAAERLRGRIDARTAAKEKELAEKYRLQVEDQTKSAKEREQEEEDERRKHQAPGGGGGGSDIINDIYNLLKQHLPEIDEKLPQHALVAG